MLYAYTALKALHLLSIIFWVGGMAFAHFCLRPAVVPLEPSVRLGLMYEVLRRFFKVVLASAGVALLSGLGMMLIFAGGMAQAGNAARMPIGWMVMGTLGVLMILLFGHIRFVLFKRLRVAVQDGKWTVGAAALASIRVWVRFNLAIGLIVVVVAATAGV